MLDNESWSKLLDGLLRATDDGGLEWQRIETSSPFGTALSFAALRDHRTLRAYAKSAVYTISSEGFASAPYELTVHEKVGLDLKEIGTLRSSTMVGATAVFQINQKLETLFRKADSSAEEPGAVVDRLLGDFS